MNLGIAGSSVLRDNGFDGLLSEDVLLVSSLYEHVPPVGILNLGFCDLNFSPRIILQLPDRLSMLSNDQANSVIGHRQDVGVGGWCAIRCHHAVVKRCVVDGLLGYLSVVQLLGNYQLLVADLLPCAFIRCDDSLDSGGSPSDILWVVTNDKHMLLVFIVRLRRRPLLLRPFSSDQNLAT